MKDKSKNEKFVESWLEEHGFAFKLIKQYNSKTVWQTSKDGIEDNFEMMAGVEDIKAYMAMYEKSFHMKCEIERLKSNL